MDASRKGATYTQCTAAHSDLGESWVCAEEAQMDNGSGEAAAVKGVKSVSEFEMSVVRADPQLPMEKKSAPLQGRSTSALAAQKWWHQVGGYWALRTGDSTSYGMV